MIISMIRQATGQQVEYVCDKIKSFGYAAHPIQGKERVVIGAVGDGKDKDRVISVMESVPGVESVIPILQPFKLVGRELKQERTVIRDGRFQYRRRPGSWSWPVPARSSTGNSS